MPRETIREAFEEFPTHPIDGVRVRRDLFGIQEGAEFRLVVLQEQSVEVERAALGHALPEKKKF